MIQGSRCKTLIQGPTTGAPSKISGGSSLGRKKAFRGGVRKKVRKEEVVVRSEIGSVQDLQPKILSKSSYEKIVLNSAAERELRPNCVRKRSTSKAGLRRRRERERERAVASSNLLVNYRIAPKTVQFS